MRSGDEEPRASFHATKIEVGDAGATPLTPSKVGAVTAGVTAPASPSVDAVVRVIGTQLVPTSSVPLPQWTLSSLDSHPRPTTTPPKVTSEKIETFEKGYIRLTRVYSTS